MLADPARRFFTQGIRFSFSRALVVAPDHAGLVAVILESVSDFAGPRLPPAVAWWSWMLLSSAIAAGVLSHAAALAQRKRPRRGRGRRRAPPPLTRNGPRGSAEAIDEARKDSLHALSHDFRPPDRLLEARPRRSPLEQHLPPRLKAEVIALIQSHARQLGAMLGEVWRCRHRVAFEQQRAEIATPPVSS